MKKNPFKELKKVILLKDKVEYYVVFKVDEITYALKTNNIKEFIPASEKKDLPNTPEFIVGVITQNNQPITLIDLNRLLSEKFQEYNKDNIIINFEFEKKNYGFFTNKIIDVIPVEQMSLNDVGDEMQEFYFVESTFSLENDIVLIINVEKILKNK
ncbi:hypothetical protein X275_03660 [Marinitoga sp. 1197]|uniref:chemotaxis protein CheW n=1 Tax=Marinitoga sp. 1197 TaxID=1428449 RepID=UPI000641284C|nr:chemotaxis protein CheW [Marinitoga sp. 1197]KLO23260.1 hypothetical protein X275_03660 [Marinitoga sp. 1197]